MGNIPALQGPGVFMSGIQNKLHPLLCSNIMICCRLLKVFADFAEIRSEIEKETERSSGDNKVTFRCENKYFSNFCSKCQPHFLYYCIISTHCALMARKSQKKKLWELSRKRS